MVTHDQQITILGISGFYHDSAATILVNGEIVAAAQEERFTRKKNDASFPTEAIRYCLQEAGIALSEIDHIVFYDKPLIKFERLLETFLAYAPRGVFSFVSAATVWIKEKIFLKKLIIKKLKHIDNSGSYQILFSDHHLSHAASAFYPSGFDSAAILTIDGVGEWSTTAIFHGKGNAITPLKEIHFPNSIGLLYSAFTYYLGFRVNSGEYKVMGLAPYGNRDSDNTKTYVNLIRDNLLHIQADGSFGLNQKYFNYSTGLTMLHDKRWQQLFGFPRRTAEDTLEQHHCDLAIAIQIVTEELVISLAKKAQELTGEKNLCLAGGVALNCVANGKIRRSKIFDDVWIQPAAGDAGGSLGAALTIWHLYLNQKRFVSDSDNMQGAYLGPSFSNDEIEQILREHNISYTHLASADQLSHEAAKCIATGKIIGWFQGRMEWGPRALGNRSILADPRDISTHKKINLEIKLREEFRPFAPSILKEHTNSFFVDAHDSPYMLFTTNVKDSKLFPIPADYDSWDLYDKLYFQRSTIPSVTHIDNSARVHTVDKTTNRRFHQLISSFYELTGCPLIVNTSFNVRSEPVVCNPTDAVSCFLKSNMDYLFIGNFMICKDE